MLGLRQRCCQHTAPGAIPIGRRRRVERVCIDSDGVTVCWASTAKSREFARWRLRRGRRRAVVRRGLRSDGTVPCWGQQRQLPRPRCLYVDQCGHLLAARHPGSNARMLEQFRSHDRSRRSRWHFHLCGCGESHACAIRSDGTVTCWACTVVTPQPLRKVPSRPSRRAGMPRAEYDRTVGSRVGRCALSTTPAGSFEEIGWLRLCLRAQG